MEQVLFHCDVCHVFRLPPTNFLVSERWEGNHIWSGSIQVTRKMRSMSHADHFIELWDRTSNELFGQCPLRDDVGGAAFQTATDSSRCFVIRIEQGDQFALLGINFEHNTDAFRFCTTVVERNNRISSMLEMESASASRPSEIRTQGKILLDLTGKIVTKGRAVVASRGETVVSSGFSLTSLPPPTTAASRRLSALTSNTQQLTNAAPVAAPVTSAPPAEIPSSAPSARSPSAVQDRTSTEPTATFDPFAQLADVTTSARPLPALVAPPTVTLDDLFR